MCACGGGVSLLKFKGHGGFVVEVEGARGGFVVEVQVEPHPKTRSSLKCPLELPEWSGPNGFFRRGSLRQWGVVRKEWGGRVEGAGGGGFRC